MGIAQGNIADLLFKKYRKLEDRNALDLSIAMFQDSVKRIQAHQHIKCSRLKSLGEALFERRRLLEKADSEQARQDALDATYFFKLSADTIGGVSSKRIDAAQQASVMMRHSGDLEGSYRYLELAVDLIDSLSISHLSIDEQETQLSHAALGSLPAEACATAIQLGKPTFEAIEVLEKARGTLLSYAVEQNSDLSALKDIDKSLYHRFEEAKLRLNKPLSSSSYGNSLLDTSTKSNIYDENAEAHKNFRKILQEIRHVKGLETFLLPPSETELLSLAQGGYIIILNDNYFRRDAIVITPTKILNPIPLSDVSRFDIKNWNKALYKTTTTTKSRSRAADADAKPNRYLRGALMLIWKRVVSPIVKQIGLRRFSGLHNAPRIWWLGVGEFARLPVHAACSFQYPPQEDCIHTLAISSYISTLRMLRSTRERMPPPRRDRPTALAAAVPSELPRFQHLKFAEDELDKAISNSAEAIDWIMPPMLNPSAQDVITRLAANDLQIVHLICHGVANPTKPSKSHLVLCKLEENGYQVDKLTIDMISKLNTASHKSLAELAFLSACHSASNRAVPFLNEALQLGTAFQLADFPHVIGTLWSAQDCTCPTFAGFFYHFLASWKPEERNSDVYAFCYWLALKHLMELEWNRPFLWAPFVHYGP